MKFRDAPVPRDQIALIPTTLGDLIADGHPVRLLDELLDQIDWKSFEEGYRIEKRGQPPIPPRVIVSILILGIHRGVRSSRKLEYQLNNNIEFMWLAHGHRIDHATIAGFRSRHRKAIKNAHRDLVRFAKDLGVVKLGELYVDGTRIKADANRSKTLTAAKATALLEQLDAEIEARLKEMDRIDQIEGLFDSDEQGEQLPEELRDLKYRQAELQRIVERCQEADADRKRQGTDPEKHPFQLPTTDQDSRILPNKEGGYAPNYTPVIGVEGELGLIVSSAMVATPNEQDELIGIVDDVEQSYGVTVETVGADAAFSIITNVVELSEERGKDFLSPDRQGDAVSDNPAVRDDLTQPVAEQELDGLPLNASTKKFSQAAFIYIPEEDAHYCPQGRKLHRTGTENVRQKSGKSIQTAIYQCESCEDCPLIGRCRKGESHRNPRRVRRDEHEEVREAHRRKMSDPEVKARYSKRFEIGERPFGQIKHNFGIRRFSSRGIENVDSEWGLIATAVNALRLMNHIGSVGALRAMVSKMACKA